MVGTASEASCACSSGLASAGTSVAWEPGAPGEGRSAVAGDDASLEHRDEMSLAASVVIGFREAAGTTFATAGSMTPSGNRASTTCSRFRGRCAERGFSRVVCDSPRASTSATTIPKRPARSRAPAWRRRMSSPTAPTSRTPAAALPTSRRASASPRRTSRPSATCGRNFWTALAVHRPRRGSMGLGRSPALGAITLLGFFGITDCRWWRGERGPSNWIEFRSRRRTRIAVRDCRADHRPRIDDARVRRRSSGATATRSRVRRRSDIARGAFDDRARRTRPSARNLRALRVAPTSRTILPEVRRRVVDAVHRRIPAVSPS